MDIPYFDAEETCEEVEYDEYSLEQMVEYERIKDKNDEYGYVHTYSSDNDSDGISIVKVLDFEDSDKESCAKKKASLPTSVNKIPINIIK